MNNDTRILVVLILFIIIVIYAILTRNISFTQTTPVTVDVFTEQPVRLDLALSEAHSYRLEVLEYEVYVPESFSSSGQLLSTGATEILTIDPPFDGTQSISRIESEYWNNQWILIHSRIEIASMRSTSNPQVFNDYTENLTEQLIPLSTIQDCWLTDECPEVENVRRLSVRGQLSSLIQLPSSNLFNHLGVDPLWWTP